MASSNAPAIKAIIATLTIFLIMVQFLGFSGSPFSNSMVITWENRQIKKLYYIRKWPGALCKYIEEFLYVICYRLISYPIETYIIISLLVRMIVLAILLQQWRALIVFSRHA